MLSEPHPRRVGWGVNYNRETTPLMPTILIDILRSRKTLVLAGAVAALAAALVAALHAGSQAQAAPAAKKDTKLAVVAYSTPREAYAELLPMYSKTTAGKGISFSQSFGASGEQSRAVAAGLSADFVHLSLAPDVDSLVAKGLVKANWKQDAYRGMLTNSVVVFFVRKGNPKGIKGWKDLIKPDVEVITPNPFTSGGARWNVMAAYGAQRKLGRTHAQGVEYLRALFNNVAVQDKSARESLTTFTNGKGDVLLGYENEAIFAKSKGVPIDYIVPGQTLVIENPVAVIERSTHKKEARAAIKWLRSPAAQRVWAKWGYRPVVASVRREFKFPQPPGPVLDRLRRRLEGRPGQVLRQEERHRHPDRA